MPDTFLTYTRCKVSLNNLISTCIESDDPYNEFSNGLVNFYNHYCEDNHGSKWCYHEKVWNKLISTTVQLITSDAPIWLKADIPIFRFFITDICRYR